MWTPVRAKRAKRVAATPVTVRERRLEESAESCLRRSGYLALQDVFCTCHDGTVTLWGCLPTYYLKQLAQHLVAETEGVCGVINEIEVLAPLAFNNRPEGLPPLAGSPA